jgi:hypothetical protein
VAAYISRSLLVCVCMLHCSEADNFCVKTNIYIYIYIYIYVCVCVCVCLFVCIHIYIYLF